MLLEHDWVAVLARMGAALAFGLLLGLEREWRGHDAGLRTHALVSLSSATITLSALLLFDEAVAMGGDSDPLRVVQGLAQAIGFIAGGLIFIRGGDVRNMTTAVSLWMAAAGGIAAGAGQWPLMLVALVMTVLLLLCDSVSKRFLPPRSAGSEEEVVEGEETPVVMPNRRGATKVPGPKA